MTANDFSKPISCHSLVKGSLTLFVSELNFLKSVKEPFSRACQQMVSQNLSAGFGIRIPVVVEVNIFTSTVPVVIWTIVEVDEVVEVNRVASMKSMKS